MTARPGHPALAAALEAVQALREVQAHGPREAAVLLLGIGGDGTGELSLIGELTSVMTAIVRQAAVRGQLAPAAARYVTEAVSYAEMTIDQQAGGYLGQAMNLLEEPSRLPGRGFHADFGLPVEDELEPSPPPAAVPAPTTTQPTVDRQYARSHQ